MSDQDKSLSKFLSLVLRHKPETIDLFLDENGWARVDDLLLKANDHGVLLTFDNLVRIVKTNNKKRFAFSGDQKKIRANQGHSIHVDLQWKEAVPPDQLFHGTPVVNIESIKVQGILKGRRHHVHLSGDRETATSVGSRYGKPVIISVKAKDMYDNNFIFFLSENGVWLTDYVPPQFLDFSLHI